MIAFKTHGTNSSGIPPEWPSVEVNIEDVERDAYEAQGFTVMSADAYLLYKNNYQSAYDAYLATQAASELKNQVKEIVNASIEFGHSLVVEFGAENVLLGIQQANQTNRVRKAMQEVMSALQSGALTDAIYEVRQIPVGEMDGAFLSEARLLLFINKVEAFIGVPLSTEF